MNLNNIMDKIKNATINNNYDNVIIDVEYDNKNEEKDDNVIVDVKIDNKNEEKDNDIDENI